MKEAVVLILDANETMAAEYQQGSTTATITTTTTLLRRIDCAKQVAMDMVSDLMIRSKTNEVSVIVLKTPRTHHHLHEEQQDQDQVQDIQGDDTPFPNLIEWGGDGISTDVSRPTLALLRKIQELRPTDTTQSCSLRGDFCDGLIVAADALYRRTGGKKYQRKIVLITDAEHKVLVDTQQLLIVLDSLRGMDCQLQVIGLEFEQQAEYEQAAKPPSTADTIKQEGGEEYLDESKQKEDQHGDGDGDSDDSATAVSEEDEDEDEEDRLNVKRQNEQLLIGLTEKTGGFVMAAKELQPILQKLLGQRTPKSTRRKFSMQIAPGIVLDARFSLLVSKASTPSLTKHVVAVDEDDQIQVDALGEEMTAPYQTILTHWDPEHEEQEVAEIAQAYRYGSDLVPMSGLDLSGLLSTMSAVRMTLLGYMKRCKVPPELCMGPPYAISGADSRKACAAISALARALQRKHQVGIATMVKSKDADPILVGLFPLERRQESSGIRLPPIHLVMLQLPFAGDVASLLSLEALEDTSSKTSNSNEETAVKQTACDRLIDDLMLPNEALDYTRIPNPFIRSFHQTVVQRALDPKRCVVQARPETGDPMATPQEVLDRAQRALEEFRKAFVLTKIATVATTNGATKKRKGAASYRDFVDSNNNNGDGTETRRN